LNVNSTDELAIQLKCSPKSPPIFRAIVLSLFLVSGSPGGGAAAEGRGLLPAHASTVATSNNASRQHSIAADNAACK